MFLSNILAHIQALVHPNPPGEEAEEILCSGDVFSNLVLERRWFTHGCIGFIQSAITGILVTLTDEICAEPEECVSLGVFFQTCASIFHTVLREGGHPASST